MEPLGLKKPEVLKIESSPVKAPPTTGLLSPALSPTPTALLSPDGETDDEQAPAPAPLIEGEEELDAEEEEQRQALAEEQLVEKSYVKHRECLQYKGRPDGATVRRRRRRRGLLVDHACY